MGADFCRLSSAAAAVLQAAEYAAGLPLREVMARGPLGLLTQTRFAQPAVVATSLAALVALRELLPGAPRPASFCAGHSVGELAALVAADVLDIEAALGLVARRSQLMAEACDSVQGGMAAVLGLDEEAVRELCREASQATDRVLELANLNAPGQMVVSGHCAALAWLEREAPRRGARRIMPVAVGGPFHSAYMRPAAEAFAAETAAIPLRAPRIPVILNQTARPSHDPAEIRRELAEQVAAPVRWSDSLRAMGGAGCELFLELGPGQVLAGTVRRTLPEACVISVSDEAGLELAVAALCRSGGRS
jgi:[acyl-carrier-protein] S-malonyltransferase